MKTEGDLAAGDEIRLERRGPEAVTVREVASVVAGLADDALRRRCAALAALPAGLRARIAGDEPLS